MDTVKIVKSHSYKKVEPLNHSFNDTIHSFLYHISFLPFNVNESHPLNNALYAIDFSQFQWHKFNPLPKSVYDFDKHAEKAIRFQGELLSSPEWYDKTIYHKEYIQSIPYQDLSAEIQRYIFERLSENIQNLLKAHLRIDNTQNPFLPNMQNIDKLNGIYCRFILPTQSMQKGSISILPNRI